MVTAFAIAYIHSLTNLGSFIRQAPNDPFCTFGLGHPTFKFISSYPYCCPKIAACANFYGSHPPTCNAMGCYSGLKGSKK